MREDWWLARGAFCFSGKAACIFVKGGKVTGHYLMPAPLGECAVLFADIRASQDEVCLGLVFHLPVFVTQVEITGFGMRSEHKCVESRFAELEPSDCLTQGHRGWWHFKVRNEYDVCFLPAIVHRHVDGFVKGRPDVCTAFKAMGEKFCQLGHVGFQVFDEQAPDLFGKIDEVAFAVCLFGKAGNGEQC